MGADLTEGDENRARVAERTVMTDGERRAGWRYGSGGREATLPAIQWERQETSACRATATAANAMKTAGSA
jgi:hypothetical protein